MDPSKPSHSRGPLEDCTNTIDQRVLDRNEQRRQRYASMPKEQKDELNRKRREKRLENKRQANENTTCDGSGLFNIGSYQGNPSHVASDGEHTILQTANDKGVNVTIDEDEERLHRGHLTQNNDLPGVSVSIDEDENSEWLHRGQLTQTNDRPVGCEMLISEGTNDDHIHDIGIESTIARGGKVKRLMILCVGRCFGSRWFVRFNHSG